MKKKHHHTGQQNYYFNLCGALYVNDADSAADLGVFLLILKNISTLSALLFLPSGFGRSKCASLFLQQQIAADTWLRSNQCKTTLPRMQQSNSSVADWWSRLFGLMYRYGVKH